jgi:hypothetical protein
MNEKQLLTKELTRPVINKFKRRSVITTYNNDIWSADLLDVSNMSKSNNKIKFLLIIVDVYSRYAYVVPLKSKNGEDVLNGFKSIDKTPKNLWVDEGKEFYNTEMKKYCKEKNINIYHTYTGLKAVHAERFNRTLRDLIFTYLNSNDVKNYLNELPKIVETYNNTYHNSIKETPYNIYIKDKLPKHKVYMENEEAKFNAGEYVRKVVVKKLFEKGFTAKWSEDIYIINKIDDRTLPIMYELKDLQGNAVKGKFYKNQLLKSAFKGKVENNSVKTLIKEGKTEKKILKEGLGEIVLDRPKRVKIANKKYL